MWKYKTIRSTAEESPKELNKENNMWEYKTIRSTAEESPKELNKLGKDGWEVYNIKGNSDRRYSSIFYFFLRREIK